jgi:O-antigen/teichoic acid export membrane protein
MIQRIRNNAFARNSFVLLTGGMIANILSYVFHLVIGRMVSVEMYGEIESLISLSVIISVPALALTMFSARYNAKTKANNNIAESNEIWKLITSKVFKVGLILLIISIFLIPWVGSFLKISSYLPIFLVFSALFVSLLASINNGVLIGWQKFLESGLSNISSVSVKLIFAVLLLYFGLGVNGVMIGFFLGGTAMYLVSFVAIKILFKNKKKFKRN